MSSTLWIISELYYPEDTSTGHYITKIAEGLAKSNDVHVICNRPTYFKRGIPVPLREVYKGVSIERCWATTLNKNKFIYKLINALTFCLSLTVKVLFQVKRGSIVLMVTNPPVMPFVVAPLCLLKRVHRILRVDDLYPEAMVSAGLIRSGGPAEKFLNWMTKKMYRLIGHFVVVGRDMGLRIIKKCPELASKITFIPNWADIEIVKPEARSENALLRETNLFSKFVVEYAGNMGPLQGLQYLLAAADQLKENGEIHFLFVGSGKMYPYLIQQVKKLGLRNVTAVGARPRSDQNNFLNACDLGIVSLVPGMAGVGVPSRSYNILAAGKPILAAVDGDSELATIIQDENVGWVVPVDQPDRICAVIKEAYANRTRLVEMGMRARKVAENKYSSDLVIAEYESLIRLIRSDKIAIKE